MKFDGQKTIEGAIGNLYNNVNSMDLLTSILGERLKDVTPLKKREPVDDDECVPGDSFPMDDNFPIIAQLEDLNANLEVLFSRLTQMLDRIDANYTSK
jgi:hypothetical protein